LKDLLFGDYLGNLAVGIIQVAKMYGLSLTANNTEGLKALVDSMDTEVAFLYLVLFLTVMDCIIRTGLPAGLTAVALLFLQDNRAVFPFYKRLRGTAIHARRVSTVIAQPCQKFHPQIGKTPLRGILLRYILCFDMNQVFCRIALYLAGYTTGLTSNTSFLVDDQS
jgi:hypothetical protein